MQKYGSNESHSYVLGVYSKKSIARTMGQAESISRAGGYDFKIVPCILDIDKNNLKGKKLSKNQEKMLFLRVKQLQIDDI